MADESRRPVVLQPFEDTDVHRSRQPGSYDIEGAEARLRFREFFRNFRQGNIYIYRDALVRHWNRNEYFVEIDIGHINEYDDVLLQCLQVNCLFGEFTV